MSQMRLMFAARSDRGLVRGNNEDSAYAGPHLLALADGMGGHAAGEVASQLMIERVRRLDRDPEDNDMLALLGGAARDANAAIAAHVKEHPATEGMGTTLSALMFNGSEFGVIHAGDSRGYRLRDGKLTQITKDDTFVQSLVDNGKLAPEDVSSHPQKSLILKAYTGRDVEPSLFMLDAKPGDRLLLCSDGLSDPVTASTIESALGQGDIDTAASTLVELALRSGGPDNVTVVVAEVVSTTDAAASATGAVSAMPLTVGAIAGDAPEPTHPDSAATRAAKLHRTPQVIPAKGAPAEADAVPSTTEETMTAAERPKRRVGWVTVSAILAVLVLVVAGGVGAKQYLAHTYYVAQGEGSEDTALTIKQGADYTFFGRPLSRPYQNACLNEGGELVLQTGECSGKLSPLTLQDLPASERGVVANLPAGSYDEVQTQLGRLADRSLPVCPAPTTSTPTPTSATNAAAPKSEAPSATPAPNTTASASTTPTQAPTPGVDCREVQ